MNAPKPQPRTILAEDGELQEIDDDHVQAREANPSAIFCNHCGTANQASSNFCRSCGQSLDEQMVDAANLEDYAPPRKHKRDALLMQYAAQGQSTAQTIASVISDIVSLLIMGGLAIWTLNLGQGGVTVIIIMAWFFLEMSRHGWMKPK